MEAVRESLKSLKNLKHFDFSHSCKCLPHVEFIRQILDEDNNKNNSILSQLKTLSFKTSGNDDQYMYFILDYYTICWYLRGHLENIRLYNFTRNGAVIMGVQYDSYFPFL